MLPRHACALSYHTTGLWLVLNVINHYPCTIHVNKVPTAPAVLVDQRIGMGAFVTLTVSMMAVLGPGPCLNTAPLAQMILIRACLSSCPGNEDWCWQRSGVCNVEPAGPSVRYQLYSSGNSLKSPCAAFFPFCQDRRNRSKFKRTNETSIDDRPILPHLLQQHHHPAIPSSTLRSSFSILNRPILPAPLV